MILVKRRHRKRTDTAPRCPGLRVSSLWILAGLWLAPASPGQDDALLEPFVVTEDALTPWEGSVGYSGRTLSRSEMALRPGATFSDQLQGEGGLRLFRRQSALTVHPTAQGASLRVGGPNGASRATVYLDGAPLNDPFGGWIPWTSLNSLAVGRISVVQPSGVDPWGNVSFGGTLRLERRREDPFSAWRDRPGPRWNTRSPALSLWPRRRDAPGSTGRGYASIARVTTSFIRRIAERWIARQRPRWMPRPSAGDIASTHPGRWRLNWLSMKSGEATAR